LYKGKVKRRRRTLYGVWDWKCDMLVFVIAQCWN